MTSTTEYAIFAALGVVLLVFLGFLILIGPLGWLTAAFLLFGVYVLAKWSGLLERHHRSPPSTKVNCPGCGARTTHTVDTCSYCGDPLAQA
ncbi:DUF2614 family zinc ribbon-containing protein [Haladaptatus sp. CMSO5]|uniref:DUF2614 family zinc ribbon-containing protein n=1 Tax=Haladaptatus sp. CMSO5 TaxID=3120514 RepID=UPI002FCDFF26